MTQPDLEETPPFTERLNRTLCFLWCVLNGLLLIVAGYVVYCGRPFPETLMTYWDDVRTVLLIIQLGYVVICSVIITLTYLISGKLLNPISESTERTFAYGVTLGLFALFVTTMGK
jgi:hypothetical protein